MVNLKKLNLRSHITLLWAGLATILSLVLIWHTFNLKQQHEAYMLKGRAVMSNCVANIEVSNKLTTNCSSAYIITKECMLHLDRCDLNTEQAKLKVLNDEKIELEAELQRLVKETSSLNQNK
ncbi:hypothetical protein A3C23_04100 [Candidatus Roizmanbacteria bacterium RIFCSPHIGHO2_02_FULL_37_13b]|uniref:Uncharacterized protein n=1 Tax=Candidatus Roizmanbacteria bacterium RIFCSPLOWO2_02_FULL_36_11 TaxID=1802071 RepID=A0A1F7JH01_9BACT|nr:MAG: hypothetical protein A3C23_04100 [Candidatus Roizmanbacteria bacterium RIFCSPHIGHO2_02_FULL_37_13b]OGK54898.1 MAG: hypothetical protein A3H78_00245 [Candidatus Roizmanbacteria bacterium RIFCSPLOWO2_02_FULL_36_11]